MGSKGEPLGSRGHSVPSPRYPVTIAANTSSTEAINFTARAGSLLAATAATAAYATAAANPLLGK